MADAGRPRSGRTPNLRWRGATLAWGDLRASDSFDALPARPPGAPLGPFEATRQDDRAATRALHAGRLTAGRLNAALGFCDGAVANRIAAPGRGGVPGAAQASVVAHLLAASVRSPGDPVPDAPPRPCAPPSALAARGIGAVRMAWGGAAEAAGVASLAAALEAAGSRVREVGMLVVSEEALKALLGDDPPPLPPLAASPDAVAAHAAPRAAVDAALQGGNPVGPAGDTIPIWLEPVEVKSACPFAAARGGASGARFTLAPALRATPSRPRSSPRCSCKRWPRQRRPCSSCATRWAASTCFASSATTTFCGPCSPTSSPPGTAPTCWMGDPCARAGPTWRAAR